MKRYDFELDKYGEVYKWEEESPDGEYVCYEDVQDLLQWLQAKAQEWQGGSPSSRVDFCVGIYEGKRRAGKELQSKLDELTGVE